MNKLNYVHYKINYIRLSNVLTGGSPLNIFSPIDKNNVDSTASYMFTRDQDGTFYFAICRKVPNGARQRISGINTGAAGTKEQYFGKWTSIGGGIKTAKHYLDASIKEINDEANVQSVLGNEFNSFSDVHVSWSQSKPPANPKMILHKAETSGKTAIFIYEMKNSNEFFNLFPKNGRVGANIVQSSNGETDACMSLSMQEILTFQNKEKETSNNNFFTSYFCNTFNNILKPFIDSLSTAFSDKWKNTIIPFQKDITGRIPSELPVKNNAYIELQNGKYIDNK